MASKSFSNGTPLNSSLLVSLRVYWKLLASDTYVVSCAADINIPIFVGLYLIYKVPKRSEFWKASEMDFYTVSTTPVWLLY